LWQVNATANFIANFCRSQATRDGSLPVNLAPPPRVKGAGAAAAAARAAKTAARGGGGVVSGGVGAAPVLPSLRPLFYPLTDGTTRLIRVMFSHIDDADVAVHVFNALANLWVTGAWRVTALPPPPSSCFSPTCSPHRRCGDMYCVVCAGLDHWLTAGQKLGSHPPPPFPACPPVGSSVVAASRSGPPLCACCTRVFACLFAPAQRRRRRSWRYWTACPQLRRCRRCTPYCGSTTAPRRCRWLATGRCATWRRCPWSPRGTPRG
jgi:hypothetical protein